MANSVPKNPPPLTPGMDNPWYDYSPFPLRPRLAWPRNARVAFYVVLHLEYYELVPPEGAIRDSRFVGRVRQLPARLPDLDAARILATAPASSACWTCSTATRSRRAWR